MEQSFENRGQEVSPEREERSARELAAALRGRGSKEQKLEAVDGLLAALRNETTHFLDRETAENALTTHLWPLVGKILWQSVRKAEADARSEIVGSLRLELALALRDYVASGGPASGLAGMVVRRLKRRAARQEAEDAQTKVARKRRKALKARRERLSQALGREASVDDVERWVEERKGRPLQWKEKETIRLVLGCGWEWLDGEGGQITPGYEPGWALASADETDAGLLAQERRGLREMVEEATAALGREKALKQVLVRILNAKDQDGCDGLGLSYGTIGALLLQQDPLIQPAYGNRKGEEARPWSEWHAELELGPDVPDTWAGVRSVFEGQSLKDDALRKLAGKEDLDRVPRGKHALLAWKLSRAACWVAVLLASVVGGRVSAQAATTDVRQHVQAHRWQSNDALVERFPYRAYLDRVEFTDFRRIQRDRWTLWRLRDRGDDVGDRFVYALAEAFTRHYPITSGSLADHVAIGEAYLGARPAGNVNADAIYRVVGYHLLGRVAKYLETEAEAKRLDLDDAPIAALVDRLAAQDVFITRPETTWQKVVRNVRQFRVGYLFSRAWGSVFGGGSDGPFKLKSAGRYAGGAVHAFSVEAGGQPVGHAVWIDRPNIRGQYVATAGAYASVAARADAAGRAGGRQPVLVATGGFTNVHGQPEGLTVDEGEVVNSVLEPERDGLVIVEAGGGIRVVDLSGGVVRLADGGGALSLRVFDSLEDYGALLGWCRRHRATVWQTQLLAYGDQLRIDPATAPTTARERRLLILVRTPAGAVQHVVLDLARATPLAEAAAGAMAMMRARSLRVEAMLNLDVGTYNIFQVYDDAGRPLPNLRGPVPVTRATNLLLYTR